MAAKYDKAKIELAKRTMVNTMNPYVADPAQWPGDYVSGTTTATQVHIPERTLPPEQIQVRMDAVAVTLCILAKLSDEQVDNLLVTRVQHPNFGTEQVLYIYQDKNSYHTIYSVSPTGIPMSAHYEAIHSAAAKLALLVK